MSVGLRKKPFDTDKFEEQFIEAIEAHFEVPVLSEGEIRAARRGRSKGGLSDIPYVYIVLTDENEVLITDYKTPYTKLNLTFLIRDFPKGRASRCLVLSGNLACSAEVGMPEKVFALFKTQGELRFRPVK